VLDGSPVAIPGAHFVFPASSAQLRTVKLGRGSLLARSLQRSIDGTRMSCIRSRLHCVVLSAVPDGTPNFGAASGTSLRESGTKGLYSRTDIVRRAGVRWIYKNVMDCGMLLNLASSLRLPVAFRGKRLRTCESIARFERNATFITVKRAHVISDAMVSGPRTQLKINVMYQHGIILH
jgi:hypothetical protein